MIRNVLITLLLVACGAYTQQSAGISATYHLQSTIVTASSALPPGYSSTGSQTSLSIAPYLGIALNNFVTIAPFVEWSLWSTTAVEQDAVLADEFTVTQNRIAIGCELLCTVLRVQNITLSLGPQVGYRYHVQPGVTRTSFSTLDTGAYDYSSYYAHDIWLGFPLCADVFLNRRLAFRLSATIVNAQYSYINYTLSGDPQPYEAHDFDVSFTTLFKPSVGFLIVF